jgi:hypothetical protein
MNILVLIKSSERQMEIFLQSAWRTKKLLPHTRLNLKPPARPPAPDPRQANQANNYVRSTETSNDARGGERNGRVSSSLSDSAH